MTQTTKGGKRFGHEAAEESDRLILETLSDGEDWNIYQLAKKTGRDRKTLSRRLPLLAYKGVRRRGARGPWYRTREAILEDEKDRIAEMSKLSRTDAQFTTIYNNMSLHGKRVALGFVSLSRRYHGSLEHMLAKNVIEWLELRKEPGGRHYDLVGVEPLESLAKEHLESGYPDVLLLLNMASRGRESARRLTKESMFDRVLIREKKHARDHFLKMVEGGVLRQEGEFVAEEEDELLFSSMTMEPQSYMDMMKQLWPPGGIELSHRRNMALYESNDAVIKLDQKLHTIITHLYCGSLMNGRCRACPPGQNMIALFSRY